MQHGGHAPVLFPGGGEVFGHKFDFYTHNQEAGTVEQKAGGDTSVGVEGSFNADFTNSNGSTATLKYTITISPVPEPNGVLMGLLGLPCLGAVVFIAHRRSAAMAAMVV